MNAIKEKYQNCMQDSFPSIYSFFEHCENIYEKYNKGDQNDLKGIYDCFLTNIAALNKCQIRNSFDIHNGYTKIGLINAIKDCFNIAIQAKRLFILVLDIAIENPCYDVQWICNLNVTEIYKPIYKLVLESLMKRVKFQVKKLTKNSSDSSIFILYKEDIRRILFFTKRIEIKEKQAKKLNKFILKTLLKNLLKNLFYKISKTKKFETLQSDLNKIFSQQKRLKIKKKYFTNFNTQLIIYTKDLQPNDFATTQTLFYFYVKAIELISSFPVLVIHLLPCCNKLHAILKTSNQSDLLRVLFSCSNIDVINDFLRNDNNEYKFYPYEESLDSKDDTDIEELDLFNWSPNKKVSNGYLKDSFVSRHYTKRMFLIIDLFENITSYTTEAKKFICNEFLKSSDLCSDLEKNEKVFMILKSQLSMNKFNDIDIIQTDIINSKYMFKENNDNFEFLVISSEYWVTELDLGLNSNNLPKSIRIKYTDFEDRFQHKFKQRHLKWCIEHGNVEINLELEDFKINFSVKPLKAVILYFLYEDINKKFSISEISLFLGVSRERVVNCLMFWVSSGLVIEDEREVSFVTPTKKPKLLNSDQDVKLPRVDKKMEKVFHLPFNKEQEKSVAEKVKMFFSQKE